MPGGAGALLRAALTGPGRAGSSGILPTTRLEVSDVRQDLERYARYARVCGLPVRDRVPASWLHVLTFPLQLALMSARAFPFPVVGLVHVENRMTLRRPVLIEDAVDLAVHAERMVAHRSGTTVDLVGTVRVDAEVAWQGRSRYLVRGARGGDDAAGPAGDAPDAVIEAPAKDDPALPEPSARWRVPGDIGRQYAAVSGDLNPIHLSALSAKALGFPRALAHGMWTHARALAAVDRDLPAVYRVDASFTAPVLAPTRVAFGARRGEDQLVLAVSSARSGRPQFLARVRASEGRGPDFVG